MTTVAADPTYGPSNCRRCGASIVWALTEAGKRIAVDLSPRDRGDFLLFVEEDCFGDLVDPGVYRVRRATADDEPGPRWVVHFGTCPGSSRA